MGCRSEEHGEAMDAPRNGSTSAPPEQWAGLTARSVSRAHLMPQHTRRECGAAPPFGFAVLGVRVQCRARRDGLRTAVPSGPSCRRAHTDRLAFHAHRACGPAVAYASCRSSNTPSCRPRAAASLSASGPPCRKGWQWTWRWRPAASCCMGSCSSAASTPRAHSQATTAAVGRRSG